MSVPIRKWSSGVSDRQLATLVGIGLLAVYVTIQRGLVIGYDGDIMLQVAESIVHNGNLETTRDPFRFNTPYSTYGFGVTLFAVPLVAGSVWTSGTRDQWATLLNPALLAAGAAVIVAIGRDLGWSRRLSVCAALAFGLLTMTPWMSTEMFAEPGTTLGLALAVWGIVRYFARPPAGLALIGWGLALSVLFRTDSLVLVVVPVLIVFVAHEGWSVLKERSVLVGVGVPLMVIGAWIAFYNAYRYGSIFDGGYHGYGFTTPILEGMKVILLQPGKGFFWYNPLLLCAIPGIVFLGRRAAAIAWLVGVLTVVRFLFYAAWTSPTGGVGWGPRFLFPLCFVLIIPAAEFWRWIGGRRGAAKFAGATVVAVLAAGAAGLSALSVWVPYEQWWRIVSTREAGESRALVAGRIARYYSDLRLGHIAGDLRVLDHATPFPLEHWDNGPQPIGVIALLVAVVCITAALWSAARTDRAVARVIASGVAA